MRDLKAMWRELSRAFAPEDLEWRLQATNKDKTSGMAVPYVTNRAIQDRLDEVVGPENWRNEFVPWHKAGGKDSQLCGISIYLEERGEWVTKWDGSDNSEVEPIKGGLSDAMKRSAVQWGIGRCLDKMPTVWVDLEQRGKSFVIKNSERAKLRNTYLDTLARLHLTPAQPGGLQSQLTPRTEAQTPAPEPQPTPAHEPPQGGKVIQMLPNQQETWEYRVEEAKRKPDASGRINTAVKLKDPNGLVFNAFAQGQQDALEPGALLCRVKLEMKQHDTVIYYIMHSYKVLYSPSQAA